MQITHYRPQPQRPQKRSHGDSWPLFLLEIDAAHAYTVPPLSEQTEMLENLLSFLAGQSFEPVDIRFHNRQEDDNAITLDGEWSPADGGSLNFLAKLDRGEVWEISFFSAMGDMTEQPSETADITPEELNETLLLLASALDTDDFTDLYRHLGQDWAVNTSAEELRESYADLSEADRNQISAAIRDDDFEITYQARDGDGSTHFGVRLGGADQQFRLSLSYEQYEDGWKPVAINLRNSS